MYFIVFFWIPAILFEIFDRFASNNFKKKYKLKERVPPMSFFEASKSSFVNHILQHCFLSGAIRITTSYFNSKLGNDLLSYPRLMFNDSLLHTFGWVIIFFFTHDILFYVGHFLMHRWRWLYRKVHVMHHLTFATQAITAHHMGFVDFILESAGEIFFMVVCFFPLGASHIAFVAFACVGVFNGVIVCFRNFLFSTY